MKHESRFGAHVGTASLLLIFLTLALVSFGSLSLAGAQADARLSDKLCAHTAEYYAADHEGQAFVAATDKALRELYAASAGEADYLARAAALPSAREFAMNERQILSVELSFLWPEAPEGPFLRVAAWRVRTLEEGDYERHLPVSEEGGLGAG